MKGQLFEWSIKCGNIHISTLKGLLQPTATPPSVTSIMLAGLGVKFWLGMVRNLVLKLVFKYCSGAADMMMGPLDYSDANSHQVAPASLWPARIDSLSLSFW